MKDVEEELFGLHESTRREEVVDVVEKVVDAETGEEKEQVVKEVRNRGVHVPRHGDVNMAPGESSSSSGAAGGGTLRLGLGPAFAQIDEVAANSPAAAAGMRVGDRLKMFGRVHLGPGNLCGPGTPGSVTCKTSQDCFANLRGEVLEGVAVEVVVENVAEEEADESGALVERTLTLTPKLGWGGQGMLGCHLVPFGT